MIFLADSFNALACYVTSILKPLPECLFVYIYPVSHIIKAYLLALLARIPTRERRPIFGHDMFGLFANLYLPLLSLDL